MNALVCPGCHNKLRVPTRLAGKQVPCPACSRILSIPAEPPSLIIPCPGCQQKLKVPSEALGKAIRCPTCKRTIPTTAPVTEPAVKPVARALPSWMDEPKSEAASGRCDTPSQLTAQTIGLVPSVPGDPDMVPLAPPQQGDELGRLGHYRILKVLGKGGMGVVYQAEDPLLRRIVALKVMLPSAADKAENRQRFLREARAAAALKHDHIVTIFQVGEDRGIPYLAMEFLQGEPLDARLAREKKLAVRDALRLGRQAAEALAAAHAQGLIHRDIKPANIWLEAGASRRPTGFRVKLLDFGLAHFTQESVLLTQAGSIMGTPAYMAPEQARSEAIDGRSDLFSLGCVLYHALTGQRPFQGNDIYAIMVSLATEVPPAPHVREPAVPPELSALILRLLSKKASERPAGAAEVAESLEALEHSFTTGATQQRPAPRGAGPLPARLSALGGRLVQTSAGFGRLMGASLRKGLDRRRPQPVWRRALHFWPVAAAALVPLLVLLVAAGRSTAPAGPVDDTGKPPVVRIEGGPSVPPPGGLPKRVLNSLGLELVLVPKGKYQMGSPATEPGRWENEVPHEVEMRQPFYLGAHEVTQKHYEQVMGKNPSEFSTTGRGKDRVLGLETGDFPVEMVNWNEAGEFCTRLSALPEEKKAGRTYRLPTEAEWEFACRDGGRSPALFHLGDRLSSHYANFNGGFPCGTTLQGPYLARPAKVGSYRANGLGLHDMHGNVAEWCADWDDGGICVVEPGKPPPPKPEPRGRALRGGSWAYVGPGCRAATRTSSDPTDRSPYSGFRVLLVVSDDAAR